MKKFFIILALFTISSLYVEAQRPDSLKMDSSKVVKLDSLKATKITHPDTVLRIINISPFFSLHVDSSLFYQLRINKNPKNYYWFLKSAPTGLKIDKDNGMLSFKANKSLFLSGRLKYDTEYPVQLGLQNLTNQNDKFDTSFTITFYNTDVVLPRIKPSVVSPVIVQEGEKLTFNVMCENGNFPIDKILFSSSLTIGNFKLPKACDDTFEWSPPYDFVNEKDSARVKVVNLFFVGTTKFNFSDTARVRVVVKDGLDFDMANMEYRKVDSSIRAWVKRLKYTFLQLDKRVKKSKGTRSTIEIASAASTVSGTIWSAVDKNAVAAGKVLPSMGVVLLPVKEAAAPVKTVEQNQATLVRSATKRLEYVLTDNALLGERDPNVITKTETLKKEFRQTQIQLIEVPTEVSENLTDKQLDGYFNNPKVQRKYRLR